MTVSPFDLNCVLTPREVANPSQKDYQEQLGVARQAIVEMEAIVERCRIARDRTPPCRLHRVLDRIAAEVNHARRMSYSDLYDEETVNESARLG